MNLGGKMVSKGIVQSIENSHATVKFYKDSACASCSACSGDRKFGQTIGIKLDSGMDVRVGQEITIEIDDGILLKLSFIVYIIPAIAMFIGYFIFNLLKFSEGISIIASFAALLITFFGICIYDKKRVKDIGEDFKIVEIK